MFFDNTATKSNIFKRSWTNFNQDEIFMDYFDKDWSNMNVAMESFANDLFDKYGPIKNSVNIS